MAIQMEEIERKWDQILQIKTSGRDDSLSNTVYYPYEATAYPVLEAIAKSGYISKKDTLIDYGCGKGRVSFFLSYQTKCRSIGVEFSELLYQRAKENKKTAAASGRVTFYQALAEQFEVPAEVTRCYFFNPFSEVVLKQVLNQILDSYYAHPREIVLFFYYPSDEYMACLMNEDMLMFVDEIDTSEWFEEKSHRECVAIFKIWN